VVELATEPTPSQPTSINPDALDAIAGWANEGRRLRRRALLLPAVTGIAATLILAAVGFRLWLADVRVTELAAWAVALLILAVLMVLKPIEKRFFKRPNESQVSMIVPRGEGEIDRVRTALRGISAYPMSVRIHELNETDDRLEIDVGMPAERTTSELLRQLRSAKTATFIIFETPEEGIGFPLSLNGLGEGYDKLP